MGVRVCVCVWWRKRTVARDCHLWGPTGSGDGDPAGR